MLWKQKIIGQITELLFEGLWDLYILIIIYIISHKAFNVSRFHFLYLKFRSLGKLTLMDLQFYNVVTNLTNLMESLTNCAYRSLLLLVNIDVYSRI